MAAELPTAILKRPKTGFGVPLRGWMDHGLKELVNDTLNKESLKKRGLFDPDSVWRLIEMNGTGRIDAAYSIFSLICIEIWCRIFIDGPIGPV